EEYRRRFPEYADTLAAQIDLHLAVLAEPTRGGATERTLAEPAPAGRWPRVAGDEVLGGLGRGGMGGVYQGLPLGLTRVVALKCVLAGPSAPAPLLRFRQEAELAARLHHPNLVQIYEVGSQDDCPYLALEFVDGPSLAHAIGGRPQPAGESARLV